MAGVFLKTSGAAAAWTLSMMLIAAPQARAEGPQAQAPNLQRTDLAPAELQQADALIEKYLQPIAEPQPTPQQKRAIESAMTLLKSRQAVKGKSAIEQFVQIGPAAIGDLRRLAATAPAENSTGENAKADAYAATMAAIIIRRIETAQREPFLQDLISLGEVADVVLWLKLQDNEVAGTDAQSRVEAATAALVKASANTTVDAPAVAPERQALAEAQATETQLLARHDMLMELGRLMAPKPPPEPPAPPEPPPPPVPPADVVNVRPLAPPMSPNPYTFDDESPDQNYLFGDGYDTGDAVILYSRRGAESRWGGHAGGGGGHSGSGGGGGGHSGSGGGGGGHSGSGGGGGGGKR